MKYGVAIKFAAPGVSIAITLAPSRMYSRVGATLEAVIASGAAGAEVRVLLRWVPGKIVNVTDALLPAPLTVILVGPV